MNSNMQRSPNGFGPESPPADSVRKAHDTGAAAWPGVELSVDDFACHVERLVARCDRAEVLARHGDDLFLACACTHGDPRAIALFSRSVLSTVPAMVGHLLPKGARVEDLVQSLHEQMLVGRSGSPPGIAAYRGAGPLAGWVRITATRAAVRMKKSAARCVHETLVDGPSNVSTVSLRLLQSDGD
jgi:RNA polymerase sigma-70 factor (ECF subfamily)